MKNIPSEFESENCIEAEAISVKPISESDFINAASDAAIKHLCIRPILRPQAQKKYYVNEALYLHNKNTV